MYWGFEMINGNKLTPELLKFIASLKQKDQKCFEQLYDQYASAIYCFIASLVSDEQLAEKLLKDTFEQSFIQVINFDGNKQTLFVWLYNIARSLSIQALNRGYASNAKFREQPGHSERLNPFEQTVVVLKTCKNYSSTKIAEVLHVPIQAVTRAEIGVNKKRNK